jgi:hypothetical protein
MAYEGTGVEIEFASGFFAEVQGADIGDAQREALETTHMLSGTRKTFKPSKLVDEGELKVEMFFDPDEEPPIDDPAEEVTITFPDSGAVWTFQGFLTNMSAKIPLGAIMTASATLKISGEIDKTPGNPTG